MPWRRILMVLAALAAAAGLVVAVMPAPREVDAALVQAGPLQVTVDDLGETRSHDRFLVSAPVAGRVSRIALHDGDVVERNQVLVEIAPLPLSTRERAEIVARVASAEAVQREAEQRVRHAEEDHAQARREHERIRKLVKEGFVAPQSAEQARNQEVTTASEVDAARFRAQAAAADVRVARAGLVSAGANQGDGAAQGPTPVQVRAPMAGRVLRIVDPSERVVATGAPLMTIGNLARLEIVIELLSTEAVRVAPGMPVLIEGWGGDKALRATVRRVEPFAFTKVSALGIEEKRVNVIADFTDAPGLIGDGFRVTARIITWQAASVLKVPASALFRCGQDWCLFVVEDGRARRRTVGIGQRNLVDAQVVSGLDAGQRVIRFPVNDLEDGARVRPRSGG